MALQQGPQGGHGAGLGLSTYSQAVSTQGSGDFRQSLVLTREKSSNIFITGANGPS